jgi:hypothetical protein
MTKCDVCDNEYDDDIEECPNCVAKERFEGMNVGDRDEM